jgi:hypothetical protein
MVLPARRVNDRIRELCAEAVAAKGSHEVKSILAELQLAIHQYTQRLRNRAAVVLSGCPDLPPERRKSSRDRRQRIPSRPFVSTYFSDSVATSLSH